MMIWRPARGWASLVLSSTVRVRFRAVVVPPTSPAYGNGRQTRPGQKDCVLPNVAVRMPGGRPQTRTGPGAGHGRAASLGRPSHPPGLTASTPLPALFQPILDLLDLGRVQPEGGADLLIGSPGHQHFAGGCCLSLGIGQDARPLPPVPSPGGSQTLRVPEWQCVR